MVTYVLIGIAVLMVLLVVFVATRSNEFHVARSVTINAPAGVVFGHVNDLRKWRAWSPWEKVDPEMKRTYEGAEAGEGAVYSWDGNKNVGSGRMTILESVEGALVRIRLEFFTPFKGLATSDITFKEEGGKTVVTWSMRGEKNFMAKAMHLLINMDKMIGGQYEKGLADLKVVAEG